MSIQVLNDPNKGIIKCEKLINGLQTINFNQTNNQIQFDNYSVNDTYYIDTSTGKTNMLFDINQLEGMKLKDFTITNLNSDVVEVQNKLTINSMDIYMNMNELIRQSQAFKISIENINMNLIVKAQQITNLQEFQQNQLNVNKEFTDKFTQQANQNLIFMNEFEDHLTRIQNSELFQASQLLMNTELQNSYQILLNKTIVYDNNFIIQDDLNNKISDKVKEHQERLDVIGPCVHKINDDYVTHSEITGFASEGSIIGLSASIAVLQTQCIAMDVGIAAAQSTATAAAATGAANSGLISTLQSQVVKLEGDSAMLTSDMATVKSEQTTIKVDAAQVASDLKKFKLAQGFADASLQGQITDLQVEKADKETTYTKLEVDAYFVAQTDTNNQLNGGILQLGSSKADQITTYSISDVDSKLALKANVVDVNTSLGLKSDKTYVDTGFNLYGSQLTTLKTRADNVDILNTTQNTNITNLQNSTTTLNNGMNTAFSRLQVIDNLNTQQSNSIVSLTNDNTTNKTDISTLKTDTTTLKAKCTEIEGINTVQTTDIVALKTRCVDIETLNTTQDSIIEIHTGNFRQINDNFTDVWGRLDKIETTNLEGVTRRLDLLDVNVGDMMPTVDFNNKWRMNEAVPKIAALETDNTTNKTNIANLTTRANEQDQTNLTFGGKITTLQTDNTKQNNDIYNINNNVITIGNSVQAINTRVTNLETFVYNLYSRGTGWYKEGDFVTCYGTISIGGGGQPTVYYAVTMVEVFHYSVTVKRGSNSGGGCDVLYAEPGLSSMLITHDYASNAYISWGNWFVKGRWR
ncbi:golgin_subfamily B member 1-like [Hexamita inflata]|uniref:Golgin subfamily B member 1-like n=1 Tax=Hexamita inflata TaxID=28002 RepID=A0AA86U1L2_9EUKA|nr:golgin subfamily B member 1-like [Hexamita inflata]